jgi:hypothetical protein
MRREIPKQYRKRLRRIRQAKQQELIDDSIVIYRLIRLPEKRVIYCG